MKKTIRLNERELHRMISESIIRVLYESQKSTYQLIDDFMKHFNAIDKRLATWFINLSEEIFIRDGYMESYEIDKCTSVDEIESIVEENINTFFEFYEETSNIDDYNYDNFYRMVDFDGASFANHGKNVLSRFLTIYFTIKLGL